MVVFVILVRRYTHKQLELLGNTSSKPKLAILYVEWYNSIPYMPIITFIYEPLSEILNVLSVNAFIYIKKIKKKRRRRKWERKSSFVENNF